MKKNIVSVAEIAILKSKKGQFVNAQKNEFVRK